MTTTTPPTTFGTRRYTAGQHAHVRIWAGAEGARGLTGELILRPAEADALEQRLLGPDLSLDDLEVLTDALFMRGRRTDSDGIRATAAALQERLQAEIDRRTSVPTPVA